MGLELIAIQTDASEFRMKQRRRRLLWESRRPRLGRPCRLEIDPHELASVWIAWGFKPIWRFVAEQDLGPVAY